MNNFCKFVSHDQSYFFYSIFKKNQISKETLSIDIYLTDCDNYYEAKLSKEVLQNLSKNSKFTKEEFYKLAEETFTGKNEDGIEVKHSQQKNINIYNLVWKKVISDPEIKIVAGSVQLTDITSYLFHSNLFLISSSNNINFDNLTCELNSLKEQYLLLKQKADELVNIKEKIEKDLYSKFVLVLNSKKEEIQRLNSALDQYKINAHDAAEHIEKISDIKKSHRKKDKTIKLKPIGNVMLDSQEDSNSPSIVKEIVSARSKRKNIVDDENEHTLESLDSNISLVFDIEIKDEKDDDDNDNLFFNNHVSYDDENSSKKKKYKSDESSIQSNSCQILNSDDKKKLCNATSSIEKSKPCSIYSQETMDLLNDLI